jgi:hypothetical protein
MSSIERFVYDRVKNNPEIKQLLKFVYQATFSVQGRWREKRPDRMTIKRGAFFGFHDKSPWSDDNSLLIAHRTQGVGNENESELGRIDLMCFEGSDWTSEAKIGSTSAWNWQQGSQLQWLHPGGDVIFNDFVDGVNVARVVSKSGKERCVLDYPIGAVSSARNVVASFCFERFGRSMQGYGYDFGGGRVSPINGDVFLVLDTNSEIHNAVEGADVDQWLPENQGGFFSHAIFSPSGNKVAFMRRFYEKKKRLRSHLFVLDLHTNVIQKVPFTGMVSHYTWIGEDKVLAYASCIHDGFFIYDLDTKQCAELSNLMGTYDGHPHAASGGKLLVFDKYPNRNRLKALSLLNLETEVRRELGTFFLPMKFWAEKRVDLHPRISKDGRFVCVDLVDGGRRSLGLIAVDDWAGAKAK